MKELFEFIFQSFWTFIGTIILIVVIGGVLFDGIADIIKALKNNNKM